MVVIDTGARERDSHTHRRTRGPMASPDGNAYSLLMVDYVSDVLERRGPYRAEHLGNAKKMVRWICVSPSDGGERDIYKE